MKPKIKALLCIALSVLCLLSCIGYASISDTLQIGGSASVNPPKEPEGIYISNVEFYTSSGVETTGEEIILPTNLRASVNVTSQNASITYAVTVHNKTDMTYWYLGQEIEPSVHSNASIKSGDITISTRDGASANSTAFDSADWVPAQTERVFYVTYSFNSAFRGKSVTTLVNFSFGFHVSSVSDAFLKVLNDKTTDYGYKYLTNEFDKNYAANKSTVVANVGEEKEIFDQLFGENLTVNIDGTDRPVTVVIERKDVDVNPNTGDKYSVNNGPSGCEYTVYITVDDLSSSGGKATVYAVSYTCGADGTWYMIGELYEGTASIEPYENSNNSKDLAFDVDSWRAVYKEYTVIGNITYKVAYSDGERPEQFTTITELMSEFDSRLFNNINNNQNSMLTKACHIVYVFQKNNSGQQIELENPQNSEKAGYTELKKAFDSLKPYLNLDNGASNVRLEYSTASKLSRAELIRKLEDVQATYDYYLAVNS